MRKNKNTSKIILATIVAGLATMISYTVFNNMQSELAGKEQMIELMQNSKPQTPAANFAYAIATRDLKAGEIVADGDVDFKPFPQADTTAFENRTDVVNKVLLQDIAMGTVFTSAQIAKVAGGSGDLTLKAGYRSLTLPADSFQGRSSKMTVGTSVDIISASDESSWALDNVKILALESSAPGAAATNITNASSVDFEVPVGSIADFISNVSKSKLVLVARNPKDKQSARKRTSRSSGSSSGKSFGGGYGSSMGSLPNLPNAAPPISNLPGGDVSGLPAPIKPAAPAQEVEMIEANVKSKVTFD